jgi:hypothetical protein
VRFETTETKVSTILQTLLHSISVADPEVTFLPIKGTRFPPLQKADLPPQGDCTKAKPYVEGPFQTGQRFSAMVRLSTTIPPRLLRTNKLVKAALNEKGVKSLLKSEISRGRLFPVGILLNYVCHDDMLGIVKQDVMQQLALHHPDSEFPKLEIKTEYLYRGLHKARVYRLYSDSNHHAEVLANMLMPVFPASLADPISFPPCSGRV